METWVFLGKEWGRFSPLRHLALVCSDKKHCVWLSTLSVPQCFWGAITLLLTRLKLRCRKAQDPAPTLLVKRMSPKLFVRFFLKKWFISKADKKTIVIITDDPCFYALADAFGASFVWVYVRPACPLCAQQQNTLFLEHDLLMIKKAALVINDSQLNKIPEKILEASEQDRKVYTMPTPPLVPGTIKRDDRMQYIAGFYGAMDQQVDIDLFSQSAMALPGWTFELHITFGKVPEVLLELPNVKVKKATTAPNFFSHWDLALMPYSCVSFRRCHNPPMLIDYIRHGLPVASTSLPVMGSFSSFVTLQRPKEAFSNTLRQAINQGSGSVPSRVNFNSWWEQVAQKINDKVKQFS